MAISYSDKLKDPRWQRKRLEIMSRDEFRCTSCSCEDEMLSVHHRYYTKGLEPWEYNDLVLTTLCDSCHKKIHKHTAESESRLLQALKEDISCDYTSLLLLTQAVKNVGATNIIRAMNIIGILSDDEVFIHTDPNPQEIIARKEVIVT